MPPPLTSFASTGFPSEILKEVSPSILFSCLSLVVAARRIYKFP